MSNLEGQESDTNTSANPSDGQAHAASVNGSDGSDLEKKVQELDAQVKEEKQRYMYLYADFDNYKKRVIKERSELLKYGWESPSRELLEVIDNLERAMAHMPKNADPSQKTLQDGIKMVLNQFRAVLEKQGVHQIKAAEQLFDPNLHEAVGQENSVHPEGTVVREETKGYTMHGRLLRPARVIVSTGKIS